MKKKMIVLMMVLATLMVGCGNRVPATTDKETTESIVMKETADKTENSKETEESKNFEKDIDSLNENPDKADLDLKEYEYSFEDRNVDSSGTLVIPFGDFKGCGDTFYLTDSVDLYIDNGSCIGFTKPNIEIIAIMEYEDWYYIDLAGKARFVKASDVEANGFAGSKQDYMASIEPSAVEEVPEEKPVQSVSKTPVVEMPSVEESTDTIHESSKYTPDEAVAIYRGLMEAGGIAWNPSLKDGGSWGTGWIYLEKGQPEWLASTDLESFAMGDSVGNPWTSYYLEVTGSDENAVYITMWAD